MLTPNPQSRLFSRTDERGFGALFDPVMALNTVRRQWPVIAALRGRRRDAALGYILTAARASPRRLRS